MSSASDATARAFRLSPAAYLVVLFLLFGSAPIAFSNLDLTTNNGGNDNGDPLPVGWQTLVLLAPIAAAVFIARTATFADSTGLRVRAAFGSRRLPWDDIRGLFVRGRSVYAVSDGGALRLPCVHVTELGALSRTSGGRLPELADPKPKHAPQRRRRR
ncbi:PH domain-containing protein [uncultured Jatrophihabitans sp.]|uniref:PH domain-containing protein n=1 Tax=uncultured Jatrophihabitans sp. TaxID=1610747 RepID=UPI0035CC9DBF